MNLPAIARQHYADQLRLDSDFRDNPGYATVGVNDAYVASLKRAIAGSANNDELLDTVGDIVDAFRARGHITVEKHSAEWREVARALAAIELEVLRRVVERDEGDFAGTPTHPLLTQEEKPIVVPGDPLTARILDPENSVKPLSELAKACMKERGTTPSVNRELEVACRMFEEHLGEEKPAYRITRQDVLSFKRALAETPSNYVARFPDMKLPEAIAANKARKTPYPVLSARTIGNKYLSRIHTLLNWAVANDILPDSPSAGIKVDAVRESEPPRVNFSPGDLSKIFGRERFDTSKPLTEAQWAELLSLFTGARASELGQVRLDSIRHERGALCIRIEEATKNRGSQRVVPVHPTLVRLGLEKHTQKLRKRGEDRLFPEWHRKAEAAKDQANGKAMLNHYYPRFYPKQFNRVLEKLGVANGRKSWHSFRHSFKSALEAAGVERATQDQLCGHADGSAGGRYIHGASIEKLAAAITALEFDGLPL
jgi:integrase